jgi:hypothetical protein
MMGPMQPTIRALAVHPGTPNSLHGRDIRRPVVDDVPGGAGVLVRVLQVGVDWHRSRGSSPGSSALRHRARTS